MLPPLNRPEHVTAISKHDAHGKENVKGKKALEQNSVCARALQIFVDFVAVFGQTATSEMTKFKICGEREHMTFNFSFSYRFCYWLGRPHVTSWTNTHDVVQVTRTYFLKRSFRFRYRFFSP